MNDRTQSSVDRPKPGERWCCKLGSELNDIIIDQIDRNHLSFHEVLKPDVDHPRERVTSGPCHDLRERVSDTRSEFDHRDINSFLNRFEKLEIKSMNRITHEISTATAMVYLDFEPESSRLSCLSVRIETPDFPDCTMEFHEIDPEDPVEFLAGLDRKKVLNGLFGVAAEIPDPKRMIETRENPAVTLFMDQVWTTVQHHLQMEIDTGMPSPFMSGLEDGGDVSEPG